MQYNTWYEVPSSALCCATSDKLSGDFCFLVSWGKRRKIDKIMDMIVYDRLCCDAVRRIDCKWGKGVIAFRVVGEMNS